MPGVQRRKRKSIIFTHNHPVSYEWSLSIFPLGKIKAQIPHLELRFLEELKAWPGLDYILCSSVSQLLWHKWLGPRVCRSSVLLHCWFPRLVWQEVGTVCGLRPSSFSELSYIQVFMTLDLIYGNKIFAKASAVNILTANQMALGWKGSEWTSGTKLFPQPCKSHHFFLPGRSVRF